MKLAAIPFSIACLLAPLSNAYACDDFSLIAQPADNDGYNPNGLSPVALQVELFLADGPAASSCASHSIEIVSQTATNVRDLTDGRTTVKSAIPPEQSAFGSVTGSSIELSQQAVNQLVSTGRLLFELSWIDAGRYYPPGTYTNLLSVQVNGNDIATVEPELNIYPAMRLLGEVSSGYGNIDFGELESFKEASTSFVYQSNTNLAVLAESQNGGKLVHEDGAGLYAISYEAEINDVPITTNGSQSLRLGNNMTANSLGTIKLRLGDIGTPVAGEYSDVLTLSFTAE